MSSKHVASSVDPASPIDPASPVDPVSSVDPIEVIESSDPNISNLSIERIVDGLDVEGLIAICRSLDQYRRGQANLYRRVRALFFLSAIHRYYLPPRIELQQQQKQKTSDADSANSVSAGLIPADGHEHLMSRRFLESIDRFIAHADQHGYDDAICSALSAAYHDLALQTLADQVKRSVRTVAGNRWMFRMGHPLDHPLRIRPELIGDGARPRPIMHEKTAVRMDLSHSAWSDIFFLGMDYPDGARVLNISVNLGVRGRDQSVSPPIETFFRLIDKPVIRLVSVDLGESVEIDSINDMFDFGRDHLGLLKAAVIAAGVMPPGLEGSQASMTQLLSRLIPDPDSPAVGGGKFAKPRGFEIVSQINNIPKGSRLAVSTNLLGSLIAVLMRATGQIDSLDGPLSESDRRTVAARAILGEWIGGSGGGWQDSGGVWPGIKIIRGAVAGPDDPEYGISRGRLMPTHQVLGRDRVDDATRQKLADSLVLVHGGMAQNVGPILEMVTQQYLLRGEKESLARGEAMEIFDLVTAALCDGDIRELGRLTTRNFEGPLQQIIPFATNRFTDELIARCREKFGDQFWGFWMLGGMSGGGMGFIFDPSVKSIAQDWLATMMVDVKRSLETSLPFAMDPVVYDFAINDDGSRSDLVAGDDPMMSRRYYAMMLPRWLRTPLRELPADRREEMSRIAAQNDGDDNSVVGSSGLLRSMLPAAASSGGQDDDLYAMLRRIGFDTAAHESIQSDLRSGRIGLLQNRLPDSTRIRDVDDDVVTDTRQGHHAADAKRHLEEHIRRGRDAIARCEVAVVTLAAGVGSRWTQGAGVCKALHPFVKFGDRHRSFLEIHLAKNRVVRQQTGGMIDHAVTTSDLTDQAIRQYLDDHDRFGMGDSICVSTGRSIGLRMVPMVRDLEFEWNQLSGQTLDAQAEKMRQSVRAAWIDWARSTGEGSDYTENVASQCVHPVGHWYEVPNLFRSGALANMLKRSPQLKYLMLHNIDTLGATVDAELLGRHIASDKTLHFEVMPRRLEDRGGGLAMVGNRPRLIEGLAMPNERIEFDLRYYNSMTTWITIDPLLEFFGLDRAAILAGDSAVIDVAIRDAASRLPTYITHKNVKKRWGHGQEDVFPVAQFEKLWGDMSAIADVSTGYFVVDKIRGGQLKEVAQLDSWLRDKTAAKIASLCDF